jgi:hypothetical protein
MVSTLPPAEVVYWVDEPAIIEIDDDGVVSCRIVSGTTVIELRSRPSTLVKSACQATRAFTSFVARPKTNVARIRGRRGRH